MSDRKYKLLSAPWWERILMGITTAIPPEWHDEKGAIRMAGESAVEFLAELDKHNIQPTGAMLEACKEYAIRMALEETGQHPNGQTTDDWEEIYGERERTAAV